MYWERMLDSVCGCGAEDMLDAVCGCTGNISWMQYIDMMLETCV